jgi:transcription elongation factor GreA
MTDQIILTPEGKLKLEEELTHLKTVKRPEISGKIEQAKELGDLSENAEYHDAKDQQGMMEARVNEIEEILKKAIVQEATNDKNKVSIGCSFVVEDETGLKKEYALVGYNEADPISGRISNESPMGQAFIDAKVGDRVQVELPNGVKAYTVIDIK